MNMIELISEIINRFGPRPAGSEAEKKAQHFIKSVAEELTDDVNLIEFDEYLDARFGKLKYYVGIYIIALALYWVPGGAMFGLGLSLINAFFIIFDLMSYRDILTTFPGKKQTSSNVEATLEPQGEVKSTILISGHMDSTREYTWWFKLGELGVKLTIVAGVLMVLQPLFYAWHVLSPASFHNYIWVGFLLLSPVLIVYWSMHAEHAVDGAQDNLSGIAIAFESFKSFKDPNVKGKSILQNTRIRFVSFGSEERGLCGSRAYAALKKEQLKKENAYLVNIDSVRLVNEVAIVDRELMNGTTHTPALVNGLKKSFEAQGLPYKTAMLPIGGTDAVSFARAGLPSVTIIGISSKNYDFTYHTRHDIVENIEPQSLENAKNGVVGFIKAWDAAR
ncbi:MAG: M20/M25/M40 family metallo-hydrolase [Chitinophagales bacterium]